MTGPEPTIEPGPRGLPPSESSRPTLTGDRHMAVTGHPLTVQVAMRVLEAGGNAVDAGVAAGLASNVVQADMCNLAGIAPILVRPAGSAEVMSVAGVGPWSSTATLEAYTARHGRAMPPGCAATVVPAALAGWLSALEHFGTWSFADVVAPAVELAVEGFVLDATVASALDLFAWVYEQWPSSAAVYCPGGRRAVVGDRLLQPDLGRLLGRLAAAEAEALGAAGPPDARRRRGLEAVRQAFYEGETGRAMAAFVTGQGGFLTTDDLAAFRAEVAPAPARRFPRFGGLTVHVTPPRWSQGPALLQTLAVLERFDLAGAGHNSTDHLHVLLEAVKLAFSDRERYYGDAGPVDLGFLLSDDHADELAARIRPDAVLDDLATLRHRADDVASTTHVAVVDGAGTAFACAPSDTLAMAPVVPGLGVVVSGRGVQSRTAPGHPAALGPGRRPRVTPAPAIVLDDGGRPWPITCPGGDVIVQAMVQALTNVAVFAMTEQQAVEAPRAVSLAFPDSFHPHTHHRGRVVVEDRVPDAVLRGLAARGHDVRRWPPFEFEAGSVGMIRQHPPAGASARPTLRAGADPRRAAYALGR
ncbi:MAG TPA: gamma-glutamyltransferase [Acidimicrobiales bacterium]|nr:gamma-glutamyltransferase [Acidimicrobiales bacterium]